jgi:hypothetical protein
VESIEFEQRPAKSMAGSTQSISSVFRRPAITIVFNWTGTPAP